MFRRYTRRDFLSVAALAAATPIFDVKPLRGIDFILQNSPTPHKYLIETMPGGAALFDYNNDGLLDIFLVNGGKIAGSLPWRICAVPAAMGTGYQIAGEVTSAWRKVVGRRPERCTSADQAFQRSSNPEAIRDALLQMLLPCLIFLHQRTGFFFA